MLIKQFFFCNIFESLTEIFIVTVLRSITLIMVMLDLYKSKLAEKKVRGWFSMLAESMDGAFDKSLIR